MAETDLTKSHLEDIRDQYETVGVESSTAIASATIDWVEQLQAEGPVFQAQLEALITQAEGLKTGPNSATTGNSNSGTDTKPEPIATTGADPTPNPIHATPAHTREPSRKIGDPVKPPHEIASQEDDDSPLNRLLRRADDVEDAAETTSGAVHNLYEALQGPPATHTSTTEPTPIYHLESPQAAKPDPTAVVAMSAILLVKGIQMSFKRFKRGYE